MATNFTSFIKLKKDSGGKVKFDRRSMRTHMTLEQSTRVRMTEEIRELQYVSQNISISDNEINSIIDIVSNYPNFTIINTKLIVVCFGIMKNIKPFDEEEFGKKVVEYENEIYEAFNVTDETKQMKLKEDIMVYSQYINFIDNNIYEEVSEYDTTSEYDTSDYESD